MKIDPETEISKIIDAFLFVKILTKLLTLESEKDKIR